MPKQPKEAGSSRKRTNIYHPNILAISLINSKITYNLQATEDDKTKFSYNLAMEKPVLVDKNVYIFKCTIQSTKAVEGQDKPVAGFLARYICGMGFEGAEKEVSDAAQIIMTTTIWGMFISLFAIITQQMGIEFPELPATPRHITVLEHEATLENDILEQ